MKRKYILLLHALIWALLILNDALSHFIDNSYSSFQAMPRDVQLLLRYSLISVGFYSVAALCFYCSYLLVAPMLFLKKLYVKALLTAAVLLAAMICWRYLLEFYLFKPYLGFDNYKGEQVSVKYYTSNIFWFYYPKYFVYGLMFFLGENWLRSRDREVSLQKDKLTTELAFLRSQINPHFLFNTINDIYALTYQKSDQAPEALLKLSELLRYMLRDTAEDFMLLQNEIDYLNNLIELQRIGAKGNAFIDFEIEGYIGMQRIASLLFVAFVENAFKHGVLNDACVPVSIQLKVTSNEIHFIVTNKINNGQKDKTGGIGLSNVQRRLELLYPNKYQLDITAGDIYTAHLKLQLT